jgi:sugar phosphate isomerase/epimerase
MRLQHPSGAVVHVSYSTNVHPAEDLAGIVAQLDRFAVPIRETLGDDVLGLGLWLAAPVAAGLAADRTGRLLLRGELADRGLEVVTINGFPYQAFHAPVVKHAVYRPDWTERARLRYTLDLASVLADLLPEDETNGSISTLPLSWRAPWSETQSTIARELLAELALELSRLHQVTGRHIRVAFEPEPGCVIETIDQAVAALSGTDHAYLGLCLDLAHLACAWEEPDDAIAKLAAAGIPVVKAQVSAGLEAADPATCRDALAAYAEPRFLHQTRTASGRAFDDLPDALDADPPGPWRIHFHVPIHAAPAPPLSATTAVLRAGLAALVAGAALCQHLEVETYTWDVLPSDRRPVDDAGLVAGIAAEVDFARDQLLALGLTPNPPVEVSP